MAFQGWLSGLSAAARSAYPAIVGGIRQGLSARAIGRLIREQGMSISNAALFEIARRERDVWSHGQSLRFLSPRSTPNVSRLPEALTRLTRQFAFTVQVTGVTEKTGQRGTQYITISTDRLMSRAELEEMAAELAGRKGTGYGVEVEEALLVSGLRAGSVGVI